MAAQPSRTRHEPAQLVINMTGIKAPSHYTYTMVRYRLHEETGVSLSRSRISQLAKPGQPLEAETHEGQRLIPAHLVMAFLDARRGRRITPKEEPHPCEGCVWRGWNVRGEAGCIKSYARVTQRCQEYSDDSHDRNQETE